MALQPRTCCSVPRGVSATGEQRFPLTLPNVLPERRAQFAALQEGLVARDATIEGLRKELRSKEAAEDKLQFQTACMSARDKDLDHLMVRVASLEKDVAEVGVVVRIASCLHGSVPPPR